VPCRPRLGEEAVGLAAFARARAFVAEEVREFRPRQMDEGDPARGAGLAGRAPCFRQVPIDRGPRAAALRSHENPGVAQVGAAVIHPSAPPPDRAHRLTRGLERPDEIPRARVGLGQVGE
jgi:hypothetical protein